MIDHIGSDMPKRKAERLLRLLILFTVAFWVIAAMLGLCLCNAMAADYGSYANMCDLDDVDCTGAADDDILQYDFASETWSPEALPDLSPYAKLDGTNGPTTGSWTFINDVTLGSWKASSAGFGHATDTDRPLLEDQDSSLTNPTIIPKASDNDTGLGVGSANNLSLIAGGKSGASLVNTAGIPLFYVKASDHESVPENNLLLSHLGLAGAYVSSGAGNLTLSAPTGLIVASPAINVSNTEDLTAGNIRWSGTDFEGYTGAAWESFTPQDLSGYSLLDGTNGPTTGPWTFGDDIQGPVSGCTAATTLTIDAGPAHCTAAVCGVDLDADLDGFDACGGASSLLITMEELAGGGAICTPGSATDIVATLSAFFTFGFDNLRLCILSAGGPPWASVLIPSSDSCQTLSDTMGGGPGLGPPVVYDDDEYFTFNSSTCTYDFTPDAGLSLVFGWNAPPTVTTDSDPIHSWTITDAGAAHFAGDIDSDSDLQIDGAIGVGETPASVTGFNQSGLVVHKTYTDFSESEYRGPGDPAGENYLRAGLRFGIYLNPDEAFDGSGVYQIGYGTQGVVLTGTSNRMYQVFGSLNQAYAGGENQTVDYVTGMNSQIGTVGTNSVITTGRLFNGDVPFTNGTFGDLTGLRIPDLGVNTTGEAIGIDIEDSTTGATTVLGIRTAEDALFLDNVKALFGTDLDGSVYSGAAGEMDLDATTTMNLRVGGTVEASLTDDMLAIDGAARVGTTTDATAGNIRWDGTDFEGSTGNSWKSFTTDPRKAFSQGLVAPQYVTGTGIRAPAGEAVEIGTSDFTVFWFGTPSTVADHYRYLFQSYVNSGTGFNFYVRNDNHKIRAVLKTTAGGNEFAKESGTLTALSSGEVESIAGVFVRRTATSDGSVTYYVNGKQVYTISIDAAVTLDFSVSSQTNYVSGYYAQTSKMRSHACYLYNRALTAAEIFSTHTKGPDQIDKWGSQVAKYTSNFSADVDSWVGTRATLTGDVDTDDDGAGKPPSDNWLKILVSDTTSNTHYAGRGSLLTTGKRYRVTFTYFLPSGQSNVDGIGLSALGWDADYVQAVTDAATTVTVDAVYISTSGGLSFYAFDGGASTFQDAGGDDYFYLKDVSVKQLGAVFGYEPEGIQPTPGQWLDSSTNEQHILQPATGLELVQAKRDFEVRWTNTWTASDAAQYIGGYDQNVLPPGAYIEQIIGTVSGADIEDIIVGDGSDTDRWVTITTDLAAGTTSFTLAKRVLDGTNAKLVVDPDADATMSIEWLITGNIL